MCKLVMFFSVIGMPEVNFFIFSSVSVPALVIVFVLIGMNKIKLNFQGEMALLATVGSVHLWH